MPTRILSLHAFDGPNIVSPLPGVAARIEAGRDAALALRDGVVEGTENPPSNMYTQRMHESQKHLTLSNHGYLGYAVIVNKKFWDGLPADIRTTLEGALKEATAFANQMATKENVEDLEKMRASGKTTIYTLTPEESNEWKKALMPVHKEMEARLGKPTIDAVYAASGFVAPK
jgi:C4-dicarboxylate-binding protein DctP